MYKEELNYIVFILGYDILQDKFKNLESNECDTIYEACKEIAAVFMQSIEYYDMNVSMYEALTSWVNNHNETIKQIIKLKEQEG